MSDAPADLGLIARQQKQLLDEMGTMRDDMAALLAIAQRLDRMINAMRIAAYEPDYRP